MTTGDKKGLWHEYFLNSHELYLTLRNTRTYGASGDVKKPEVIKISGLLSAIVDQEISWSDSECERCFREIIQTKASNDENREILLATAGLDEGYKDIKDATRRRKAYLEKIEQNYRAEDQANSLIKRENNEIKRIADKLYAEYVKDPASLYPIISNALTDDELKEHGLLDLVGREGSKAERPDLSYLKRTEKIRNIGEPDGRFVGREYELAQIEESFQAGQKVIVLGGAEGYGKTRIALHYAQTHDYQMVCWISCESQQSIVGSILEFFLVASVPCPDTNYDAVLQLFSDFFSANRNWLIVFDKASLSLTKQRGIIRDLIPDSDGDVIITANYVPDKDEDEWHFLFVDSFGSPPGKADGSVLLGQLIGAEVLDPTCEELVRMCDGTPIILTFVGEFMRQAPWVTSDVYFHLLQDYGLKEHGGYCPYGEIAADIACDFIHMKKLHSDDPVYKAAEKVLGLCAVFGLGYIDLPFLSHSFPILADDLKGVYDKEESRERLVEMLRLLGFYEIRRGLFHYSVQTVITEKMSGYVRKFVSKDALRELLGRIDDVVSALNRNEFIPNRDYILTKGYPYVYRAFVYVGYDLFPRDNLAQRYPNIFSFISSYDYP